MGCRYIAIVHPLHYSRYMTKLVTRLLMSATWSVAVCISCIPVFWNDWHEGVACEMNVVCTFTFKINNFNIRYFPNLSFVRIIIITPHDITKNV